jgi:hypothetical protein
MASPYRRARRSISEEFGDDGLFLVAVSPLGICMLLVILKALFGHLSSQAPFFPILVCDVG